MFMKRKLKLELRFHQELIVLKTIQMIENSNKPILWGVNVDQEKHSWLED